MSAAPYFASPPAATHSGRSPTKPNFPPTPDKLASLLDRSRTLNQTRQIHAFLYRHNLLHGGHPIVTLKLQRSYSNLGRLDRSLSVFSQVRDPDVYLYTSLIQTLVLRGLHRDALQLYVDMLTRVVPPNEFTLSSILKFCPLGPGRLIHGHAVKLGLDSQLYVTTCLMDVYARGCDVASARKLFDAMPERSLVSLTTMITCFAKGGMVEEARALFDGLEERDAVSWNVMIDGYVQHGLPNEGLLLFRRMLREVKPTAVTLLAVLSACGQVGAFESGKWIHSYIQNSGMEASVRVSTALIDMYAKCGSLEDARIVFDKIANKDVVAWNSMIVGYATHGFSQDALQLFNEMIRIGLKPTDITFIGVLHACGHGGLVSEGRRLFRAMKDVHGIEPKVEHYGCMVNLFGRAGHLEEAYKLMKNMEIATDAVLWSTLLGACKLHGNIDLGEEIAEFLISQNLANSGTYILLSNMYASAGNWEGVAKMRTLMKDGGVEKEPGCSSIEVGRTVHEFFAADKRHPKSREIYLSLEEMHQRLKAHGYTPQTDLVLQDLGEAEKEQSLLVHSEKLAIAYGLISTKPGTPLKVVKNLRVCSDCHAAFMLLSKITDRKIVMRDRNRFHHFVDGSCSCNDYW